MNKSRSLFSYFYEKKNLKLSTYNNTYNKIYKLTLKKN